MRLLFEGGSYFFEHTLSAATIRGRLLFEGDYYSGCGYYLNKYGMYIYTCPVSDSHQVL